jgi:hypothetical protein
MNLEHLEVTAYVFALFAVILIYLDCLQKLD